MTQYYVSPTGDNTTGLSPSTAWTTIASLNAKTLAPSDIVSFNGGSTFSDAILSGKTGVTYNSFGTGKGILSFTGPIVQLTVVKNVTFDNLSFQLTGNAITAIITSDNANSRTDGCDNIIVQNCLLDGGQPVRAQYTVNTFTAIGILAARPDPTTPTRAGWDTNWQILNNTIQNCGDSGIMLCGQGHVVDGNTIQHVGMQTRQTASYGVMLRASNCIVKNNTITDANSGGVSVRYCNQDIYNNIVDGGTNGVQILMEDFYSASAGVTLIHENKFHNIGTGIYYTIIDATRANGVTVSFEDLVIYNNTFEMNNAAGIGLDLRYDSGATGAYQMPVNTTVKNNIFIGTYQFNIKAFPPATGKVLDIDYNQFLITGTGTFRYNNTSVTFATWKSTSGMDAHSVSGDPIIAAFPSYLPTTGSNVIAAGTANVHRQAWIAKDPTSPGVGPRLCFRPQGYALPTTNIYSPNPVTTSQQLVDALASTTIKNIIVAPGTYTTVGTTAESAGYFNFGVGHKVYAQQLLNTILQSGVVIGNSINAVELHGLKFTVSSSTQAFRPAPGSASGVIYQFVGGSNSQLKIWDCAIDAGGTHDFCCYIPVPDQADIRRLLVTNAQGYGVFLSDNVYNSSAVITAVNDIYAIGIYSRVNRTVPGTSPPITSTTARGSMNGTGEAGLWLGNKVSGGVNRIKVRDCGWLGIWGGNHLIDTVIDSADIDIITGTTPPDNTGLRGETTGTAVYYEHGANGATPTPGVTGCTLQNSVLGPNIIVGHANEWNHGVSGQQAASNNILTKCLIDVNGTGTGVDKTVGIFLDEGTLNPTITHVIFRNMRYACIVDLTNEPPATNVGSSSLTQNNNDFSQRGTRSPTGIAATVTYTHPGNSA